MPVGCFRSQKSYGPSCMVDQFMENGFTYFDAAAPYHWGPAAEVKDGELLNGGLNALENLRSYMMMFCLARCGTGRKLRRS